MSNLTAFTGHLLPVWDTCFLPELGYYFASGGADRTVRVWNTERKKPLRIMNGHSSDVEVIRWHPNYQILATGSSDNSLRVWDISSGSCVALFEGHKSPITSVEFAPNGKSVISGDSDGELKIWDLGSRQIVQSSRAHSGPIWSISHSLYDSTKFATGGNDCTIHVWDSNMNDMQTGSLKSCFSWQTKATPVTFLRYHADNLVVAAGPMALYS
jgi:transcription initiation factor TFIID subunit 5